MQTPRGTIVVLGATGQQGGAVAAALREDGWPVRALVRDPSSASAGKLAASGIELVTGDLDDPASLHAAFTGAHGVFSVQPSSGQQGAVVTDEQEIRFGTSVADIAQRSGVAHLVYSSTIAVGATPTGVGHLDTKREVERHLQNLDLPTTVVRPVSFMELLVEAAGHDEGRVSFLMRADQSMQFIAARDIGRVVALTFAEPGRHVGRVLEIAGDSLTGDAVAEHLSRAAARPISYARVDQEVVGRDAILARTVGLVDEGTLAGDVDVAALREEFPFLLTFEQWLDGPGASLLAEALLALENRAERR